MFLLSILYSNNFAKDFFFRFINIIVSSLVDTFCFFDSQSFDLIVVVILVLKYFTKTNTNSKGTLLLDVNIRMFSFLTFSTAS